MWWIPWSCGRHRLSAPNAAQSDMTARRGVMASRGHCARRAGSELVSECEAFLRGRIVESLELRTESVPVWAWTNLLAHGSAQDLRAEDARVRRLKGSVDGEWRLARSFLVTEVLYSAEVYGSLAELQRAVLVPLELKLVSSAETASWTPGRWAMMVERALAQQHEVGRPG